MWMRLNFFGFWRDLQMYIKIGKKFPAFLAAAAMALCTAFPFSVGAENKAPAAGFNMEENADGSITVTGYGGGKNAVIPAEYGGKKVTAVGSGAFAGTDIISVTIPASVASIHKDAFKGCGSLEKVIYQSCDREAYAALIKNRKVIKDVKNVSYDEHQWKGTVTKAPTETEDGTGTVTCKVCGESRKVTIPAGTEVHTHTFSNAWQIDKEYHWHAATCGHDAIKDKAPHSWDSGTVTTPATETEDGVITYACTVCGAQKAERIPAGTKTADKKHVHSPSDEWFSGKDGHWHVCGECGERTDFAAHTENDGVITVQPTENSNGEITYRCRICGAVTRTETVPMLGADSASETKDNGSAEADSETDNPEDAQTVGVPADTTETAVPEKISVSAADGWQTVTDAVSKIGDSGTVEIDMKDAEVLPKEVTESLCGKNVNITAKMDNGIVWTINGMDITKPRSADISAKKNTRSNIPEKLIDEIRKDKVSITLLSVGGRGDFGFDAVMNVELGMKYDGLYANSFRYDSKTDELEFTDCGIINGRKADLNFTAAADYVIVISKEPMGGFEDVAAGGGIPLAGIRIAADIKTTAYCFVLAAVIPALSAAAAVLFKRRFQK